MGGSKSAPSARREQLTYRDSQSGSASVAVPPRGYLRRQPTGLSSECELADKARGKTEPFLDPAQQQHAAVGRQPAAVETGAQFLVLDG